MTAATQDASTHNAATGPKTAAGKAISARNALAGPEGATTQGLFCRQTVLPHLGEDPAGFQKLLDTLSEQLRPRNLMERQYLELWADASWKLRRLSRLEAQVWEDSLDEDARPAKLERLIRLQTSLRRQLDRAVRMLSQDVPNLFAHRTREDILAKLHLTEAQCAENPYREQDVERAIQANRHWPAPAADFTDGLDNVDNATSPPDTPPVPHPLPSEERAAEGEGRRLADGERGSFDEEREAEACENKICQNEPVPALTSSPWQGPSRAPVLEVARKEPEGDHLPAPPEWGTEGRSSHPLPEGEVGRLAEPEGFLSEGPHPSPHAPRRQELQELEDRVNSGTLTNDECRDLLMSENIPGFSLESGGRIRIHR